MSQHDSSLPKSAIRDNRHRGNVGNFLKAKVEENSTLSIVSAYFTIYAFDALKEQLLGIKSLKFLFGEPRFIKSLDPSKTDKKAFQIEDQGLQLQNRLQQKRVAKECAEWIEKKVQIRSVKQSNLLHGKMYHIAQNGTENAIMGSSNFTMRGLGLGKNNNNIELNLEVDSKRDTRDLKAWFDELWNDAELIEDVTQDVLLYLEQLYQNNYPEFIYYKTLFHIFETFLDDLEKSDILSEQLHLFDTEIWKSLFEFQKDGVKAAINKIRRYNGCIIADSVGLGKTFEALAVIKYFELRNEKVLVLCPKKLRDNWTVYLAQNNSDLNPLVKDRFNYTVLSHTDLSRDSGYSGDINLATINWGNYDLVVIDESHNFRNNIKSKRDESGNLIRKSRYERLMDDIIKSGVKTQVLLLSATPVNNDLKDLRNQLYFITEGSDAAFRESLGIVSLRDTLADAQRKFTKWAKKSRDRKTSELLEELSSAFFKLLDELTIARSRKHIQKYYKDAIAQLGGFPERLKPISVFPEIDREGEFMSYEQLNSEISKYQLSLFNPSKYVLPPYRSAYENKRVQNFKQSDRERSLIGMIKVNFLKRLESSVNSFAITMQRTIDKISELQKRLESFKNWQDENAVIDFNYLEFEAEEDEDLRAAWEVGKLKVKMLHLDVETWLKDLKNDKKQLKQIYNSAQSISVERDAKLAELKSLIAEKVKHPTTNKHGQPNRKVLVFTAFADTAVYLYEGLREWATLDLKINLALVTGGSAKNQTTFGKNEFNHVLTNFSPFAKKRAQIPSMRQDGEIDLLIATDCISEGQNLQDCDYLINYDIHWNPVRIIQRFGRCDRIGSPNHTVQLINFWPTEDLDQYINLKNRVEARMALADIAGTFEDNLLEVKEIQELIESDLKYRDKQLLRLRDEVLDIEDFTESVALTEFTLDDFRMELAKYIESNRKLLQDAPLGLYAVVPTNSEYPIIAPGVIFCLKQKGDSLDNKTVNPLQPYFVVYVRENKEVRLSFAQPKQILEIYRLLCAGCTVPYEELCNLFDRETNNGFDMSLYNDLLKLAVDSIADIYKKRSIGNLLSSRRAVLVEQAHQVKATTDFELITWLVIK
ncbi:MAG: DEAD/DEAH box helicase family protein [Microcoleus sp. PH2017_25_DOB_D_A]|uniref:helicase-related protein n=1 Tax=unclassified Microcoleus TaxID=2642155 RepID=UPI001D37C683|nr:MULTISPECIES: helicase-related protein [unclassified Microcoleus]TAE44306.1 MAG: ATP-dependent helicase [Oscillatoriales cyanobacterium]MCC3436721.1 DEAD/DEAH box helicase family protein [Microcoleus sp. PH2017_05_CCC_O_A]MCC3470636.1 DEAD/DEAH box helicase family protein [Microcoleus sp. PH2017_13_LAR_U_A]MCC3483160.1 DEAD/DEAH box helicase family protein [Microcoleus sp. PH2017_14_LAR_D_A]MCC3490500.1 DEAD/DEAH box helicase family protein [Microcoleus sp. PH2017_16_JOR_D_A]